ncbi:ribose 5-phosphate isomerase B [Haliangium sp.]|uniref:ribose 5-phosphate isomerase B n=1 Tax=Haliangium sp. TaxID=2663208 RepID=UPI003D120E43
MAKRWFAGSDHAGVELKRALVALLRGLGDQVDDLGTDGADSVDYPDFAAAVGERVTATPDALGLLVCGTGNGIAIAANKVVGVRAAVVTCAFTARMAREHNDANVIAMGSRVIGPGVAEQALRSFRDAAFEGGRHQRRVDKIAALEAGQGPNSGGRG